MPGRWCSRPPPPTHPPPPPPSFTKYLCIYSYPSDDCSGPEKTGTPPRCLVANTCVKNAAKGEIPLCNPDQARFDSTSHCRARCDNTTKHFAYEQYATNNTNCTGPLPTDSGWLSAECCECCTTTTSRSGLVLLVPPGTA